MKNELYKKLIDSEFDFIGYGEKKITEIYKIVQEKYPVHCIDTVFCPHYKDKKIEQPEWKHIVRNVLQVLKKQNKVVKTTRTHWFFNTPEEINTTIVINDKQQLPYNEPINEKKPINKSLWEFFLNLIGIKAKVK